MSTQTNADAAAPLRTYIFPLNTVLFPGGALPLKIFEQRYIEMTKVCISEERPFGVCLIKEGREVGTEARGAHVGEVVVVDRLGAQGFLRTGHRHVEHSVHF